MKLESVVFAIAGVFFGLITGWIIGTQYATMTPRQAAPAVASGAPAQQPPRASSGSPAPVMLDEAKAQSLKTVADRDPKNATARTELGNLYYDAGRYPDAIKWYGESLALNPKDVNVSTDLGVSFYYNNQPDEAIRQLERSLEVDPTHAKTLLNLGVVRAFGKQDLKGATEVWKRLVEVAPQSPEGQQAKQALDNLSSAHGSLPQ